MTTNLLAEPRVKTILHNPFPFVSSCHTSHLSFTAHTRNICILFERERRIKKLYIYIYIYAYSLHIICIANLHCSRQSKNRAHFWARELQLGSSWLSISWLWANVIYIYACSNTNVAHVQNIPISCTCKRNMLNVNISIVKSRYKEYKSYLDGFTFFTILDQFSSRNPGVPSEVLKIT